MWRGAGIGLLALLAPVGVFAAVPPLFIMEQRLFWGLPLLSKPASAFPARLPGAPPMMHDFEPILLQLRLGDLAICLSVTLIWWLGWYWLSRRSPRSAGQETFWSMPRGPRYLALWFFALVPALTWYQADNFTLM